MQFRSTVRRGALICAVIVGVAVGSRSLDAVPTAGAAQPDKSDSSTEEIKRLGSSTAMSTVALDLGPDNIQVKH